MKNIGRQQLGKLRAILIKGMASGYPLTLAYRSEWVKFEESKAALDFSMTNYGGLVVGQEVRFRTPIQGWCNITPKEILRDDDQQWGWAPQALSNVHNLNNRYAIIAFAELSGGIVMRSDFPRWRGGGCRIKDIFAILGCPDTDTVIAIYYWSGDLEPVSDWRAV